MKKFGIGKKRGDGDDDSNRSALFGKRGSPGPASDNPYAQSQPANDPYMNDNNKFANMTPYQKVRSRADAPGGLPSGPSPQSGYGGPPPVSRSGSNYSSTTTLPPYSSAPPSGGPPGGYANDRYGTSSGYGASKYSNNSNSARAGGYGGLGRTDSNDTDANRDALFSGARDRYDQRQTTGQNDAYGASGASGPSGADSGASKYGGYGEQRELTEEEQEELEVDDIKRQIKQEKLASAQTAENSARIGQQTVELASQTLARLGGQAERLNYTETLIDRGGFSSREAEEQTKKLKSLNRSMFAVHVSNPFTAKKRTAQMEQKVLDENRADRELRESTRKDGYVGNQRMEAAFRQVDASGKNSGWQKQSAAEKSKYAFEDDEEDEEAEDRIENSMAQTAQSVSQLNTLAHLLGNEIDTQNQVIDRIGSKSDKLSDATAVQTRRLKTIR
ncbi:uncharacterized protein F4822DRAFT_401444 [Hypoxylon trugodes]|uniref:uncharacterized protein n=1 Tax=Hypoxylon trugodes TaxID=326681 RepID=UPI0021A11962|nr:uncharacterized protein F4822DRAFT_401444 [Hypoxylon trugodes]KAI1390286.1 hypothetical protein F4822DRAFT_401444 [Hypoxylon trugodes]